MKKKDLYKKFLKFSLAGCLFIFTGCSNIFKAAANKESDQARLEEVSKMIDAKQWDEALEQLEALSSSEKEKASTRETWASAYAGRCGLDFFAFFGALGQTDFSSTSMFKYFMNAFTGVIVNPNDCQLAQQKIEEISTNPALRTSSQNLFMAVLGMVKIGTYLRGIADTNGPDGLGNGLADTVADGGTYSSCSTLAKDDAKKIMTGIGLITSNLTALTDALSDSAISDSFGDLETLCSGNCGKTDYTLVNDAEVLVIRNMLMTGGTNLNPGQNLGIDDTCTADITSAPCCLVP